MASFEVKVYRIQVEEHPNADALELARVGGYVSLDQEGLFLDGRLWRFTFPRPPSFPRM